jgi:hypothetical protein
VFSSFLLSKLFRISLHNTTLAELKNEVGTMSDELLTIYKKCSNLGATPSDTDADSICTAIQKIYDDRYSSGADEGGTKIYHIAYITSGGYSGSKGSINVKGLFPDNYTEFTIDNFILAPTYFGYAQGSSGTSTGTSGSRSYDSTTGTLTYVFSGGSGGNAYGGKVNVYLVIGGIISLT